MKKTLLAILLSLLGAAGIHAQTGNVVMILFPGAPTGSCSPISQALNVMNGDFYVCPDGTWHQVGGGGGGGISGTVSSPFVPFASGPDALSDSLFQYNATSSEAPCNLIGSGPCFYADDTNDTVVLSSEGFGIVADGFGPVVSLQPASISVGLNGFAGGQVNLNGGTTGAVRLQPGASDSSLTIKPGILNLGVEGVSGGSLTLNDATMGSFALATDTANPVGAALEFTNVNTVGTGALDMSIFPDGMVTDVAWSAPGTMAPFVGWFIGPTTVKTIADIVDVNTTTLNPDTTGFPCGPMGLGDGQIAHFSDGNVAGWGDVLTGGGAHLVLAYCDGTDWTVIAGDGSAIAVASVAGTTNQINSTGGATPVLSLSSTIVVPGTISSATGFTATSDGVHAGINSLIGNTTAPAIPSNSFGFVGPNSASFTSWFIQPSATAPTAGCIPLLAVPSTNVSAMNCTASLNYVAPTLTVSGVGLGNAVLALSGTTSGTATLTAPATAGTRTNPVLVSNSLQMATGNVLNWNADTGISRDSSGALDIGNGTAGDKTGTLNMNTMDASNIGLSNALFGVGGHVLIGTAAPTIAGAGCGGSAASITANNGPGAFKIGVGTGPGSACTVTLPTATTGWNCYANDITTQSTAVSQQKQTGAESATSVTITNYSDLTAATSFVANDVLKVHCFAD